MPRSTSQPPDVLVRPLAPSLRLRLLGAALVAAAGLLLLVALLSWALSLPSVVMSVAVVVVTLVVLVVLAVLGPRHWVLRLDDDGYRVRGIRSAQARSGRWSDVLDVRTGTVDGVRCTMLRLRDGRRTTVPVDVLAGDSEQLVERISALLDRSRGYKRTR